MLLQSVPITPVNHFKFTNYMFIEQQCRRHRDFFFLKICLILPNSSFISTATNLEITLRKVTTSIYQFSERKQDFSFTQSNVQSFIYYELDATL